MWRTTRPETDEDYDETYGWKIGEPYVPGTPWSTYVLVAGVLSLIVGLTWWGFL